MIFSLYTIYNVFMGTEEHNIRTDFLQARTEKIFWNESYYANVGSVSRKFFESREQRQLLRLSLLNLEYYIPELQEWIVICKSLLDNLDFGYPLSNISINTPSYYRKIIQDFTIKYDDDIRKWKITSPSAPDLSLFSGDESYNYQQYAMRQTLVDLIQIVFDQTNQMRGDKISQTQAEVSNNVVELFWAKQ